LKLANQKMTVVAYEINWDISWEPGMPDRSSPGYYLAENDSHRYGWRKSGCNDVDIIRSEFPDFCENFAFRLWNSPTDEINAWSSSFTHKLSDIPNPIQYAAILGLLEYLDYPCNFDNCPIMSPQMLATLKATGEFRHHVYPTQMKDFTVGRIGMENTGLKMNNFIIVQTLEFLDPYDWVNSDYTIERKINWEGKEEITASFTKLVLREPLPPFFRLNGNATTLYVSAAAKEALQASDTARGAKFFPVNEEYEIQLSHWYPIPEEYLKNIIDV
jgi:hypothetical protein